MTTLDPRFIISSMPVFHFILHAYRSWNADHPEGYYQQGEKGVHPQNIPLGRYRNQKARFDEVEFNTADQLFLIESVKDICLRREWRFHGIMVNPSHLHVAISWREVLDEKLVQTTLKPILGLLLAKRYGLMGRAWFSKGGWPERVKTRTHLLYLLHEYFPSHKGSFWREETT